MTPGEFFEDLDSKIHVAMGESPTNAMHEAHHFQQAGARFFAAVWGSLGSPGVAIPPWPPLYGGASEEDFRSWLSLAGTFLAGAAGGILQHSGDVAGSQDEIDEWYTYAAGKLPGGL